LASSCAICASIASRRVFKSVSAGASLPITGRITGSATGAGPPATLWSSEGQAPGASMSAATTGLNWAVAASGLTVEGAQPAAPVSAQAGWASTINANTEIPIVPRMSIT
jgi:hypothetical protein